VPLPAGQASIWAVTSYFNPARYRRRLANYRVFRRNLEFPLLTIEWSPSGDFELGHGEADILVRVEGGDLMWQKERLLNIALESLPPSCAHVAWVDCDVVFARKGIPGAVLAALERAPLVQLYDRVLDLAPVPIESLAVSEAWAGAGILHERVGTGRLYNSLRDSGNGTCRRPYTTTKTYLGACDVPPRAGGLVARAGRRKGVMDRRIAVASVAWRILGSPVPASSRHIVQA
jgi:hypothetical protein